MSEPIPTAPVEPGLARLAVHLRARRGALLETWRAAVRADPAMTTGRALTRAEVYDHIPALLAAFERDLTRPPSSSLPPVDVALPTPVAPDAEAHGLHRWQQGYDLREVTRELGWLNETMSVELERYGHEPPLPGQAVMAQARQRWARACTLAIGESTAQYFRLQQLEAAGHIEELEAALDDLLELERLRAELWQQAAHDLRGNVAVVANATAGLAADSLPAAARQRLLLLLQRNVGALNHLLNDVTLLARLQAGEEHRRLSECDVAALLGELCQGLGGLAEQRGLYLHADGPQPFIVLADGVKTRRIAQNLLLNALANTHHGGVVVQWGEHPSGDGQRWVLTLRDTGPGLRTGIDAPLAKALQQATTQATTRAPLGGPSPAGGHVTSAPAAPASGVPAAPAPMPEPSDPPAAPAPTAEGQASPPRRPPPAPGEGLGLSIVKRLCDLLDATIEIESGAGRGTTFRILFPRSYPP